MTKDIYKFCLDCGRQGSLDGIFVADSKDIIAIKGMKVYFGEALGKHSEVISDMTKEDGATFELASSDPAAIKVVEDLNLSNGTNPFSAVMDNDEQQDLFVKRRAFVESWGDEEVTPERLEALALIEEDDE